MKPTKIGLFGIGLDTYWPQFAGLKERLEGYLRVVEGKLSRAGIEIVNLGLIDTPEKAMQAGHDFRVADVDVIFLHVTTYALSSTVLPVVQRAKVQSSSSISRPSLRLITPLSTRWATARR